MSNKNINDIIESTPVVVAHLFQQEKNKEALQELNRLYREGSPAISDKEYDTLISHFGFADGQDGFMDNAPLKKREARLPILMTSVDKLKNMDDYKKWLASKGISMGEEIIIMPKYDGNSVCLQSLEYEDIAITRGATKDGIGTECSEHFKLIETKNTADTIYVGELMCAKSTFKSEFEPKGYTFPRGVPAGKIREDEPSQDLKHLTFIKYGAVRKNGDMQFKCKSDEIDFCNTENIVKVRYRLFEAASISDELLQSIFAEFSLMDYDIDGLILEINDKTKHEAIGRETSTQNPGWQRAYKNFDIDYVTEITGIRWQISKYGYLKPVAQIRPVVIDGNTIENIYVDNARAVSYYGLTKNPKVKVVRAGNVIPRISAVLIGDGWVKYEPTKLKDHVPMPITHCPECNSPLKWTENGVDLVCPDVYSTCHTQKIQRIVAFFENMGVEGLSDPTYTEFYKKGFDTVKDIMWILPHDMTTWDGWGARKAEIAWNNIQAPFTKKHKLIKVMDASSCFPLVGEKKMALVENILVEAYAKYMAHIKEKNQYTVSLVFMETKKDTMLGTKGIGEEIVKTLIDNWIDFLDFVNTNKLHGMIDSSIGTTIEKPKIVENKSTHGIPTQFEGWVAVFTGFRSVELEQKITDGGGRVASSFSGKVTHVITKEIDSTSSKVMKAKEAGATIMSKDELEAI